MSVLVPKTQVLRDHLQGEDHDLPREYKDRRRPGRPVKVHPSLIPLLRGEAVPYRPLRGELDPPYGLEHTTPSLAIVINLLVIILLLCILSLLAWAWVILH